MWVTPATGGSPPVWTSARGLAGAAAAATLAEQGYPVQCFSYHDTPRRAHSIAAQGGINAAKNYRNDGDSIDRLFKDTVKGGDFRAREANVYRLAQISIQSNDPSLARGGPFTRDYRGLASPPSFSPVWLPRHVLSRRR